MKINNYNIARIISKNAIQKICRRNFIRTARIDGTAFWIQCYMFIEAFILDMLGMWEIIQR
ncbi:hypothetical protein B7486_34345 [cyanobacterium TDX16]|nr:hypothetical protein B7486_34345 [cyanobacterium TDX16]